MSTDTVKKSFWNSFAITDRESCARAIRSGGFAAMISAAITCAFALSSFFTSSPDKNLNYLLDPWILLDVALIVVLGIFIFRKSRIAATLMVVYFAGSKLLMWTETGEPSGILLTLAFLLLYVNAMRATYIWHSRYREAPITMAS